MRRQFLLPTVLKKSKPFVLGICQCGCNENISIKCAANWNRLKQFKRGHNTLKGSNNIFWKSGIKIQSGYRLILTNYSLTRRKYIFEHRLIWEEHHNAILLPWGIIHHKDGNRQNNIWYNLQGMTRRIHILLHKS